MWQAKTKQKKDELTEAINNEIQLRTDAGIKKNGYDEFTKGFNIISQSLKKEMYQMITMGGNAELELVDSIDPFSER